MKEVLSMLRFELQLASQKEESIFQGLPFPQAQPRTKLSLWCETIFARLRAWLTGCK